MWTGPEMVDRINVSFSSALKGDFAPGGFGCPATFWKEGMGAVVGMAASYAAMVGGFRGV